MENRGCIKMKDKVLFMYDYNLRQQCDKLPTMLKRASIVYDLLYSYKLLFSRNMQVASSKLATEDELKNFHSAAYIDFLKEVNEAENLDVYEEEQMAFGLSYDCPLVENTYHMIQTLAGGSLTAAKFLVQGNYKVAINWFGGWHHAHRNHADGFCYVNDIVIAIQKLTEKFSQILYIDLDVHHGDGVQKAFQKSRNVLTLSLHKYSPGFYPGSGSIEDVGLERGQFYSLNVPLREGIGNISYLDIFNKIFPRVISAYNPSAVVVQCGADIIREDPIGECNVTPEAMGECIKQILKLEKPTLVLGGGGYNFSNTARYWAYLTSIIVNEELPEDIPDDSHYFVNYGPTYELNIHPGNLKDHNTKEYINEITTQILKYCDHIPEDGNPIKI